MAFTFVRGVSLTSQPHLEKKEKKLIIFEIHSNTHVVCKSLNKMTLYVLWNSYSECKFIQILIQNNFHATTIYRTVSDLYKFL